MDGRLGRGDRAHLSAHGAKPDWGIRTFTGEDGKDHLVRYRNRGRGPFRRSHPFRRPGRRRDEAQGSCWSRPCRATTRRCCARPCSSCCPIAKSTSPTGTMRATSRSAPASSTSKITPSTWWISCGAGPDTHVIAVCQPAPLTLAATAYLAEEEPDAQPRSLTLIGGPIDPDATPTDVTDFRPPRHDGPA